MTTATIRTVPAPAGTRRPPADAPPWTFIMITDHRNITAHATVYRGWRRDGTAVYFVRSAYTGNLAFAPAPTGYLHEASARADALRAGHVARVGVADYAYWVPDLWPLPVAAVAWLYRDAPKPPRSRPRRAAVWHVPGDGPKGRWVVCDIDAAAVAYGTQGFNVDCQGYDTLDAATDAAEEQSYGVQQVIDALGNSPTI